MGADSSDEHQRWDEAARHETEAERLDRNWASLLQELRVVQTGVQLLTGLLLTLPFHDGFEEVDHTMRMVYLVTVACSVMATALLIAPVGMHRMLFRRRRLNLLVSAAHRCAYAGLLFLAVTMAGVTMLIFDTVGGRGAGVIAGLITLVTFVGFWLVLPLAMRSGDPMTAERSSHVGSERGE
ncbi:DUF6328 family protein [Mycolicibacterium sp. XJ870]